jgi:hypothetical protein
MKRTAKNAWVATLRLSVLNTKSSSGDKYFPFYNTKIALSNSGDFFFALKFAS